MAEAPSALILGGCGFVGRNLVQHLVEKKLCSKIKVVDRTMPAMAFLSDVHKAAFASVEFKQADLTRPAGVEKAFEGGPYTLVYNLTYDGVAFGQEDRVYEEKVLGVTTGLYAAAVKNGATHFIELSTAQVYEPSDKACNEGGKLKPWTKQAGYKLQAEEALAPHLEYARAKGGEGFWSEASVRAYADKCSAAYQLGTRPAHWARQRALFERVAGTESVAARVDAATCEWAAKDERVGAITGAADGLEA